MVSLLKTMSTWVNRWVERLVCLMGISMAGVVAAQVFSRYALNHSLFWSEELARFLLVWLTFLGATVAYYYKAHPGVDVVFNRLSQKLQRAAFLVVSAASLGLFSLMVWHGAAFAWFVRRQITPALGLPKWVVMVVVPAAGLILILHCLYGVLRQVMGSREHHDH